jgi:ribulose-5-phosphate 4-epimerase/fuculose-1-phosphate aldolase
MEQDQNLIFQAKELSKSIDFVQGAGGNLSSKINELIWIKASGTRLKDAASINIFLPLNLEKTKSAVLQTEDLEYLVNEKVESSAIRPSIETALHCLLPHKYVTHVHSVGSIAVSIQSNAAEIFEKFQSPASKVFIPYAKPGLPLAHEILKVLNEKNLNSTDPLLILLQNHGLISAADDSNEVLNNIFNFEDHVCKNISFPRSTRNLKQDNYFELFPEGTLNPEQVEVLTNGPLTPDQVIYLGATPFCSLGSETNSNLVIIHKNGAVWVRSNISNDALEVVESFIKIAFLVDTKMQINYLNEKNVDDLINWDAEKWRKSQEK